MVETRQTGLVQRVDTFPAGSNHEVSAPGGKSVYWQAKPANPSRDMPVESFYGWALNPDLRPVPGTGEETPDSARRSYVRRERYDYRVDFFGRFWRSRNLGCCAQARTRPSRRGVTEAEYDRVMDINLKGAFLCSKYALPGMVKRRRGVIVNVASDSAFRGAPGSAVYGASKAGLLLMTKCMALEHARDGIRVNAICPGEVRTPMMEADARRQGLRFGEYYRRLSARIPMGRAADPDQLARSIPFLAIGESSSMTGAGLSVDGGSTAR